MDEAKPNSPEDAGYTHGGGGYCRSCRAPIHWAEINGKRHPVDRAIDAGGNIILWKSPDGSLHGRVLKKGEPAPEGHPTRKSHFATCVNAKQHRRGGSR